MADRLYKRECRVVVGTREYRGLTKDRPANNPGLSVSFRVERSLKSEPNTAEIQVINLNETSRRELEAAGNLPVQLQAGYVGFAPTIFLGELRAAPSTYEAPNWLTVISSGDGDTAIQKSRASISFQSQVSLKEVIEAIARAMRVGIGNTVQLATKGRFADGTGVFLETAVIAGSASDELDRVLRGTGLEWSIQGGVLQLLERGKPAGTAVLLTPETGLVGSPTVNKEGVVSARSLMNGDLTPGRLVTIRSKTGERSLRVEHAVSIGDTAGTDWYVDIAGRSL